MTALLYPVAETAEAALHAPLGYAARAREAETVAAGEVRFTTELVGPAFASREAALEAYGAQTDQGAEVRWGELVPVSAVTGRRPEPPVRPSYREGRRWPAPAEAAPLRWRLTVSYWRLGEAGRGAEPPAAPARAARRSPEGRELPASSLNALARQPLRAIKPQQPLDIGLFEVRRPEAPDAFIPDE